MGREIERGRRGQPLVALLGVNADPVRSDGAIHHRERLAGVEHVPEDRDESESRLHGLLLVPHPPVIQYTQSIASTWIWDEVCPLEDAHRNVIIFVMSGTANGTGYSTHAHVESALRYAAG